MLYYIILYYNIVHYKKVGYWGEQFVYAYLVRKLAEEQGEEKERKRVVWVNEDSLME